MFFYEEPRKFKSYEDLVTKCQLCHLCSLSEMRLSVVVGEGKVPADLMIVGEAPGEEEDKQGRPFVGRSGQLLTKILESVNINRQDIYITNTVKCRPPKNRDPSKEEIISCQAYLHHQLYFIKPKILLTLGTPAFRTILDLKSPISQCRGNWYTVNVAYMDMPLYIMPLFHPSYLLRNSSSEKGKPKWLTWQDIQEVKKALDFYKNV